MLAGKDLHDCMILILFRSSFHVSLTVTLVVFITQKYVIFTLCHFVGYMCKWMWWHLIVWEKLLEVTNAHHRARRAFVFIKHIHLLFFFKWLMVCLDKTYSSSGIVYSCTETVILTFNRLESIETNYMDTNPARFSSKTFISFRLKKEIQKHLGWHGGE